MGNAAWFYVVSSCDACVIVACVIVACVIVACVITTRVIMTLAASLGIGSRLIKLSSGAHAPPLKDAASIARYGVLASSRWWWWGWVGV